MNKKIVPLKIISSQISEFQLETILQTMDRLHDAATTDSIDTVCALDTAGVVGWLEDIIYTAQETVRELQGEAVQQEAVITDIALLYRKRIT